MPVTPITVKCQYCKKDYTFLVDIIGYQHWVQGLNIQKALPSLSKENREHICF